MSRYVLQIVSGITFLFLVACSAPSKPVPGDAGRQLVSGVTGHNAGATALVAARSMLGIGYRFGGADPRGFDCSGLVQYSYAQAGISLPRTSQAIFRASRRVNPREMRAGDLVFFKISSQKITHVGIYADHNRFIHAPSSGKNVSYASLKNPYWKKRLIAVGRL